MRGEDKLNFAAFKTLTENVSSTIYLAVPLRYMDVGVFAAAYGFADVWAFRSSLQRGPEGILGPKDQERPSFAQTVSGDADRFASSLPKDEAQSDAHVSHAKVGQVRKADRRKAPVAPDARYCR
jgi:hypothetical protein